jgi:nucleotide-binding universal stress UspA family protein
VSRTYVPYAQDSTRDRRPIRAAESVDNVFGAAGVEALSEKSVLTVLGATGRGGFRTMLTGSVALSTVAKGHGPVVVVRTDGDGEVPDRGHVLLAVDGTPAGEEAIGSAFEEASLRGAPIVAVHVWMTDLPDVPLAYHQIVGMNVEAAVAERQELLAQRLAGWREKYPEVDVRRVVVDGSVAGRLLELAEGAQLVVAGSHGYGELLGSFLGSVSRALLAHAPCPVLIARPQD